MNKTTGGALALLSALAVLFSGSSVQAQGLLDTLKNIAANQVGNNVLGGPINDPYGYGAQGYGAQGYGAPVYGTPAFGAPGFFPVSNSGGLLSGITNAVKQKMLNGYAGNYVDPNLVNSAYGYGNPNFAYDPNLYANGMANGSCQNNAALNNGIPNWNNGNVAGWSNLVNANGLAAGRGGCYRKHKKHRRYNNNINNYSGPNNGFYSYNQGVPLGGIGYNPLLVGR